ncbi:hypothetical protein CFC21_102275 [Triticum aestivum]|uniref:Uncharacterized protein n=4 Tax=Triticum TaxID=4564 RepID=A0A9R0ZY42_TRITD|nr:uncharacterized protein LOC123156807 [Triticum aestivum]XP_044430927.1 uncharacterized protein LOC123156807 [Triticum aestivum]KAF7100822.1 hypothetical protein CFC21_102275 [Triticum aestivum]VAI85418.1 unnamed protein product [Triticum turgidum subsp. durum]
MDGERVERGSRHPKKKGKHRHEEGKAKDKSKRHRDKEATGTDVASDIRENGKEEAVIGIAEEGEGRKSKKGKGRHEEKNKVNVSVVSGSIENGAGEEQAKKSGSMAMKPCSEGATDKVNVKKDKKKKDKKKEKEAEATEQKQSFDTTVGKEQAEPSSLMAVKPRVDFAEGDTSKDNVKKDKKKKKEEKKEEKEAETTGQKQTFDTTVENSGAEPTERDTVDGKQSSKSKKSKRKHNDGAPAVEVSAGDQIVTREDKKRRKEPVVLEASNQTQNTNEGENREIKKRGKESSKASPDFSENASAGGEEAGLGVNNDKKKKKSKGIGGGKKKKEKAARSTKGKRVSSADSVEMFRTEGGDGDGIGGRKKKEKAAPSKKKGKRVSFADSAEVFSIEGGNNEEDVSSDESKRVHGRFTPEEDATLMEAMRGYAEMKQLGEKGLEMIGSCRKYPELKGCWDDIAKSLPHRPYLAIYRRAHTLLYRSTGCKWTHEEKEQIQQFVEKNGTDWKTLAQELGKSEIHVKHAWRRIKPKKKKGADDEEDVSGSESELVHGHRFTAEEDAILMEAMRDYAELKQLGEKGLEMIGSCSKYPELKGCWDDIAKSLPHRPHEAIYHRARILLYRGAERKWTDDEKEKIRRFVEINGTDWKTLARELGKSEIHVKDTWRRMKPKNLKKGRWTQDEHQNLFDLVNLDLRLKAHQIKNPDHRMLRDNISWEAISDKLTTRNHKNCCLKWYETLASPMVKEGIWSDVDDYLLVEALQKVDAVCIEDVDWDSLLDHRSGEVCRQRWNQMVRAIGGHREKPFIEQVEVLSRRYCPEMIEYRSEEKV